MSALGKKLFFVALGVSVFATSFWSADARVAISEKCLVIQQNDAKVGKMTLYIGDKHARIDCMNDHCTLVAAAPKWDVTLFNKDRYATTFSAAEWQARGLDKVVASKRHIFKSHKHTQLKYMGRSAIKVVRELDHSYSEGSAAIYRGKVAKSTAIMASSTYIGSNDFVMSPGAARFVEGFYLSPEYARVILKAYTPTAAGENVHLETKSISTKLYPETFFAVPGGLKKAHSITAVIAGEDINGLLLDITEEPHR